ncbi:MAG: DNA methyltransferase [Nitrospirota bacterium]
MKQTEIIKFTIILDKAFVKAKLSNKKQDYLFSQIIIENVDTLIEYIDSNKSLLSALVTSLAKKVIHPKQDVRLHRIDFKGGYSARTLDTSVTVPFFKIHFPKYANKESSFLTLSTRERIKWTKKDGQSLKIRNKAVKNSYLELFDAIETKKIEPLECLTYIFSKLQHLSEQHKQIFDETIEIANFSDILNINKVIKMLEKHFKSKLGSRLPVIAIYSIYQELFKVFKRYEDKKLRDLNVHTSSDKHGFGDVEIWNRDGTPFEMVEIKHNISIDRNMIFDIVKKTENMAIERYYILTTCMDNFISKDEEEYINKFILKIKKDTRLEIIANGIVYSIKYYLRFINDYKNFIQTYTKNLIKDAENSTEIKECHIKKWKEILKEELGELIV